MSRHFHMDSTIERQGISLHFSQNKNLGPFSCFMGRFLTLREQSEYDFLLENADLPAFLSFV